MLHKINSNAANGTHENEQKLLAPSVFYTYLSIRKLSFFLNFKKAREKGLIHSIILLKKLLILQIFIVNKHPRLNDF